MFVIPLCKDIDLAKEFKGYERVRTGMAFVKYHGEMKRLDVVVQLQHYEAIDRYGGPLTTRQRQ